MTSAVAPRAPLTNRDRRPRTVAEWAAEPEVTDAQWVQYLDFLEEHGTKAQCAKRAGIRWWRILQRQDEDGEFRDAMEHALVLCGEALEEMLVAPGLDKRQVVGLIVRLKAIFPERYIERNATGSLTVNVEMKIEEKDASALLTRMLLDAQPHTMKRLLEGTG